MKVLGSKFGPTQQSVYPPMSLHSFSPFTVDFRLVKRKHPITYPKGINGTGDTLLTFSSDRLPEPEQLYMVWADDSVGKALVTSMRA